MLLLSRNTWLRVPTRTGKPVNGGTLLCMKLLFGGMLKL